VRSLNVILCLCAFAAWCGCVSPVLASESKSRSAGTIDLIRTQVVRAKEHAASTGTAASQAERVKAELQGQAEKDRVERISQTGGARPDAPPIPAAELAAMRERAAQYAEYMKRVGEAKAAQKEREAEEKSAELQRQADELEHQLTDESYNRHRDIKLNPVGTNLYVRNYSQIAPTVTPMRAQAASLSGAGSVMRTTAKMHFTNGSVSFKSTAPINGSGAVVRKTNVSGKVLAQ
jgi:hypothetical protein